MITLAAADTLAAQGSVASQLTSTVFGMELNAGVETYKVLDQRQLAASAATIYTVPGSTTTFVKSIAVVNNDSVARTAQYFRGGTASSNALTPPISIQASGMAIYEDGLGWQVYNSSGQLLTAYGPILQQPNYGITGTLAETFPRSWLNEANGAALSTGRLTLQAIWLSGGMIINHISFWSATTALGTGTHQIFGLFDLANRNLLATTTDDTSTAWSANSLKTLNTTAAYTVPYTGFYYLGIMVAATTVPTLKGPATLTASQLHGQAPIINGTSSTGLTTALPNPAAAITVSTVQVWGAVS